MARKLRVEYPGAICHVLNRGDGREPIFKDDQDHRLVLDTMSVACARTGWQVHAYVLMRNHFHLVLETPGANLVAGMKWFPGTYTSRFNRRHKLLEATREAEDTKAYKAIRRGWCLGDKAFRKELLEQMSERVGLNHGGTEVRESEEQHAEAIVARELARRKWDEEELGRCPKGDAAKARIAQRLRRETTVTHAWIAQRLGMGTASTVRKALWKLGQKR